MVRLLGGGKALLERLPQDTQTLLRPTYAGISAGRGGVRRPILTFDTMALSLTAARKQRIGNQVNLQWI